MFSDFYFNLVDLIVLFIILGQIVLLFYITAKTKEDVNKIKDHLGLNKKD